jgi:ubiquinol oxidase
MQLHQGDLHAAHAVSTYRQFIIENAEKLKRLPAPKIARQYYLNTDPYLFNMDSALARGPISEPPRVVPCETLYDVFVNILEDEWV